MKLVVGIGNPGPEYEGTRHNVGFAAAEQLAARRDAAFRKERFWNSERARVRVGGEELTLLKPLSYVNLVGPVVRKVTEDLEVSRRDILVVLDDFWLPLGRLRVRTKGGDGGHNGLASILKALGTRDVPRLRIGIGAPGQGEAVNHVLSRFREDELETVRESVEMAADAVEIWASEGIEAAMNRYNKAPDDDSGGEQNEAL